MFVSTSSIRWEHILVYIFKETPTILSRYIQRNQDTIFYVHNIKTTFVTDDPLYLELMNSHLKEVPMGKINIMQEQYKEMKVR